MADGYYDGSEDNPGPGANAEPTQQYINPLWGGEDSFYAQMNKMFMEQMGRTEGNDLYNVHFRHQTPNDAFAQVYGSADAKMWRERDQTPQQQQEPDAPAPTRQGYDTGGGGGGSPVPVVNGYPMPQQTQSNNNYAGLEGLLKQLLASNSKKNDDDKAYRDRIRSQVLGIMDRNPGVVDPNDPNIESQMRAYHGETDRALRQQSAHLAEQRAYGGTTSGSAEAATKQGYQRVGQGAGALKANLQGKELSAQRQQLMSALGIGAGVLSEGESNSLQERMGGIDALLKMYGAEDRNALDWSKLGLDRELGLGQLGVAGAGVGAQNRATDLHNQQFYDDLTYTMGKDSSLENILANYLLG